MKRILRVLPQVIGVGLIVTILWIVGWEDTVTGADGTTVHGRVIESDDTHAVVRTDSGVVRVPIEDARSVRSGLRASAISLWRNPGLASLGVLAHLLALLATFLRWAVLLRGADLATPLADCVRVGWVGHFFASIIPGGVAGGDVVRSVYIARTHSGRKTRAVLTVWLDRIIGLAMLCAIAAVAVLLSPKGTRFDAARTIVLVLLGLFGIVCLGLLSRRLRRMFNFANWVGRLPMQHVVEEVRLAFNVFSDKKGSVILALLVALGGHGMFLLAFYFYGRAIGIELPMLALFVAVPVAQIMAAIPGLPGGWGVGDFAMFFFMPAAGVPAGLAVALSFLYRLNHTLLSLPGGLLLGRYGK
ncbi:MAG: lysylphosphatidylglycerol synthase transmembrane domain-containing protein [Planctomycetota bacterium]